MKPAASLLSALFVASFGVASAQQPGQQPGEAPDEQRGAEAGQQAQQGQQERERDQEIAAAESPRSGDFLTGMEEGHIRTDVLERSDLVDSQGEDIGNITGVLIDQQSGEVAGLLVNLGGIAGVGSRNVALSWDAVEISSDQEIGAGLERYEVSTQLSMEDFENAPEFEEGNDQVALGD